ncbi:ribonuclease H-like domain-containing protein [Tanacetum coccineum]|uniref:Ribonuclease H-like domain-containing protein n=1 Tax=Tanacetum coccineum TaxID=301880 RepID=A0ABQ4ZDV6_9ASTR
MAERLIGKLRCSRKVNYHEDEDDCFTDFETEFPAIVFDNTLTSDTALLCAPTVSPPNENMINFRISLDESNDEDYTVIFDENSFSYKIIFVNDLKKDSENDEILKPLSSEPTVDYLDDLDYFNDFENEFPAIVYNDSLTSKPDLEIEPPVSYEHVSKSETSLSEYDEVEQNVLHFSNSSPLDEIFPNDPKMIKDGDDNIFTTQPSRCNEIKRSNELPRENHDKTKKVFNEKILIILDANIDGSHTEILRRPRCDDWREVQDVKILDAYDHTLPQKEKDPGSFTLPCFIHNICFNKALVDLGASVSVMPFSTYTHLGLGILSHTRLTIELANRTIKQPRGIAENVLVRIGKFIFPIDFIILEIPEDDDVPLILGRPFLSTAHSKIDVFKRKITLGVGEEKLVFKSIKPATSIIKRVFVIKSLDLKTKLIEKGDESFDPTYGNYIELNDLDTPLETKTGRDVDFEPTFVKTNSYMMKFSCVIGYKYVNTDILPSLSINLMSKSFYYSIIKDNDERKSHAGTLIDIPVFVRSFSIITGFTIIDGDDITKDVVLGMRFCKKYALCQTNYGG